MFSKKIVPDFSPRKPFVKTKEREVIPETLKIISMPEKILISESQKTWQKPPPIYQGPIKSQEKLLAKQIPLINLSAHTTPSAPVPLLTETPISGGNVSYIPSLETFTSQGEPYFKLTSDNAGDASQWSLFPALDSVQMNTRSLINVGGITGFLCQMNTVQALQGMITPNILTNTITVSTGMVNLVDNTGNHVLEAIGGDLFFDTQLLAKAGDLSNVADWSVYPALSTVNFNNEALVGVSTINTLPLSFYTASNWSLSPAISTVNFQNNDLFNVSTINGLALSNFVTNNWASFKALGDVNLDSHNLNAANQVNLNTGGNIVQLTAGAGNALYINGIPIPTPTAPGVTSVNGSAGAITLDSDITTISTATVGTTVTFSAPTLGTSGDLYPVNGTAWGKANYASLNATSAGLAAGGAQTTALAAQASADAAAITAGAALADATTALAQSGITSVNGGSFAATIAAGSGIGVATTFSSGTTNPTVTISATGTAGVTTLNTLTGALTIDAGVGMSVSTGTTSITLSQTGITSLNAGNLDATILAGTGIGLSTSYSSGSNNPTLVITNTGGGGGAVAYVASYNIFVAPNGSDVTGNGSANNPYLTIARALTARALIPNTVEVAIQLFSGTYNAPSIVLLQNTFLIGIPSGEANQPVNINAQITLQGGATGQVALYGLNLFPASSQCVIINTVGTYNINACNFVNTTNYCLFQSLGTCYLTECRMTCYTGVGGFAGIGGSGTVANLIMRDCVLSSAGVSPMVQFTGNLTMRQCTLSNTNATASVSPLVLFNPTAASTTCEISLSQLIYTSATTAANKMCIRVTPSATFNVALVNTVNNLLICEGATSGSPNFHCIENTGAGTCTLFYGNLLAGATAHNIGSGITKTEYVTVP